jgi:hypothetical protein
VLRKAFDFVFDCTRCRPCVATGPGHAPLSPALRPGAEVGLGALQSVR